MLDSTLDQIKSLKADDASWCSSVVSSLQDEHDIVLVQLYEHLEML